jgi:hypothetical protein
MTARPGSALNRPDCAASIEAGRGLPPMGRPVGGLLAAYCLRSGRPRLLTALGFPGMLRGKFLGGGKLRVWVGEVAFGGGGKLGRAD